MFRHSKLDIHFRTISPVSVPGGAESDETNRRLAPYISQANQILCEHDLQAENCQRLSSIVQAALDGRAHFLSSALHQPDQEELDQFFADLIVRCIVPPRARCM